MYTPLPSFITTQMTDQELVPVFKIVDDFATETTNRCEIPHELTINQRSVVHEYIKQRGFYSESIQLKGSTNKKIAILRFKNFDSPVLSELKEASDFIIPRNIVIRTEDIAFFSKYTRTPFPCSSPDYVEYYVKLFDPFYDTVKMWELFKSESKTMNLRKEANDAANKIHEEFQTNTQYIEMMDRRLKGIEMKMKKDVYEIHNNGKYFLSIDIKTANFTVLRQQCPTLFTSKIPTTNDNKLLLSWQEFVKRFTDSEFVCRSKYFRELVFGQTGFISKAATLQEILMDEVHQRVLEWAVSTGHNLEVRMKCGDENVYELQDHASVVTALESLKDKIGQDTARNLHFRVFRVDQIESKIYFVKTFTYNSDWNTDVTSSQSLKSKIEFKKVPKHFMPQVIKWYLKQKIQTPDLIFMHEGIMAQYMSTIFE